MHDRAHAALAVLAAPQARELSAEQREEVGDYLLGQRSGVAERLRRARTSTARRRRAPGRTRSPPSSSRSRGAPLPEIPAGARSRSAGVPPAPPLAIAPDAATPKRLRPGTAGANHGARAAQLAPRRRAAAGGDRRRGVVAVV